MPIAARGRGLGDGAAGAAPGEAVSGWSGSARPAAAALVVLAAWAALLQLHLTRFSTIDHDEYGWLFEFRHLGSGMLTLWGGWFDPLARFLYNVLFATAGIADYLPFRLVAVAANLILAAAVFAYGRRIGSPWPGVGACALLLVLGSSAPVVLMPLSSMNAVGLAALPACLLLLEHRRVASDVAVVAVLLIAMGFAGPVVVPACAALAVWLCLERPVRLRRLLVPALPVGVYVTASLVLRAVEIPVPFAANVLNGPAYVSELASAGAAGLLGVRPDKGAAILVGLLASLAVCVPRLPAPARRRAYALMTFVAVMWTMIAVNRAHLGDSGAPRYVAFTVVPVVLLALEWFAGGRGAGRTVLAAGVLAFSVVGNLNMLIFAGRFLEAQSGVVRAELGALELAFGRAPSDYRPDPRATWPLIRVTAGDWAAAIRRVGSPALRPDELPRASAEGRMEVDRILLETHGVTAQGPATGLPAPAGTGCTAGSADGVEVPVPWEGLRVFAGRAGAAEVRLRRFGDEFPERPFAVLRQDETVVLEPAPPDRSPVAWVARLDGASVVGCGTGEG